MRHMIYADNAATTKLDMDAFEAMRPYLLEQYANASQHIHLQDKRKKLSKSPEPRLQFVSTQIRRRYISPPVALKATTGPLRAVLSMGAIAL